MKTNFLMKSLNENEFSSLFDLIDDQLAETGAVRMIVDKERGFPCRVSLDNPAIGEEILLLPYQHHKTNSPYQSSGPLFVRKQATTAAMAVNQIPVILMNKPLSLRGYDEKGFMKEAAVTEVDALSDQIDIMFSNPSITYIHIHSAKQGCYNCSVERV
ncbi:DUF1203 domain-containing protein [Ferruginibacter paludis]|uniref:DUF1203 domain-containing protein n=1 Tax=Ferruginibacter paludis TaxID=1310417 RepID=UPI0025B5D4B7|nr:DUF1203 domain-containing protein [Ferruginibacter paludis]MDN3658082.1 DUF1203 domain-containing protein [Ferruginibacter paludis]